MKMKILLILVLVLGLIASSAKSTHYLVEDEDYIDGIDLVNSDTLLMTGGEINGLNAYNTSTATILDTIPMEPMDAGIRWLNAYDSSTINFSGGSVWTFEGYGSSTVNIDGGVIRYLIMNDSSVAHMSGVQIDELIGVRNNTSYVHIYGYDFDYNPLGGSVGGGFLAGFWPNGDPFSFDLINLTDVITYDQIIFHVIPEPASILFVGIGSLILCRRRKR